MPSQVDEIQNRIEARMNIVQEHVRCENRHDLSGIMQTFGTTALYDELPWRDQYTGRDGVQAYYTQLLESVPDLQIDVQRRHVAGDTIVLEAVIRGTHLGPWRGLPATGRSVAIPLCAIYTFDQDDRLAGEKIYYDRATVLRQLGVFHEPQTGLGKVMTVLTHPFTMLRAVVSSIRRH